MARKKRQIKDLSKYPVYKKTVSGYVKKGDMSGAINFTEGFLGYRSRTPKKIRDRIKRKIKKIQKESNYGVFDDILGKTKFNFN